MRGHDAFWGGWTSGMKQTHREKKDKFDQVKCKNENEETNGVSMLCYADEEVTGDESSDWANEFSVKCCIQWTLSGIVAHPRSCHLNFCSTFAVAVSPYEG